METKTFDMVDSVEALQAGIARVRAAQKIFAAYTQEQVDKIFLAAATAANQARVSLASGLGVADQVLEPRRAARAGAGELEPAPEEAAGLVVLLALLGVAQDGVCLRRLLEARQCGVVVRVLIRVVGLGDLTERLLDLIGTRALGDAEDLVVVLFEPVLRAH